MQQENAWPPRVSLLDSALADRIAAGEVVERPAAVVKELIENALDAGATRIGIEAEGGGFRHIRVSDNGHGMRREDAVLALQRHATSKVHSPEDLEKIVTFGFRGEALAGIASVSRLILTTCPGGSDPGVRLTVVAGVIEELEEVGIPRGTVVEVENLFFNAPSRRHFLRSPRAEGDQVLEIVLRFLLGHPGVAWRTLVEGVEVLNWPGCGTLLEAASVVFGREAARSMRPVFLEEGDLRLEGLIALPTLTRPHRGGQYFYVNGRFVRHRLLLRAVDEAYGGQLDAGRHPALALFFQMVPDRVDVNVHPTKGEVRFRQEADLFRVTLGAIREGLGRSGQAISAEDGRWQVRGVERGKEWWENLRPLGQLRDLYIVAESLDGLVVIDQHAAHERVWMDRLAQSPEPVSLDPPQVLPLSFVQMRLWERHGHILERAGFAGEPFGRESWLLRSIPEMMPKDRAASVVDALLDRLETGGSGPVLELETIRATVACHLSYRAGEWLEPEEIRSLLTEIAASSDPWRCPHGRPTALILSDHDLARLFDRREGFRKFDS